MVEGNSNKNQGWVIQTTQEKEKMIILLGVKEKWIHIMKIKYVLGGEEVVYL